MPNMNFGWSGPGSLRDALTGELTKISTPSKHGEPIFAVRLWFQDGRVLSINSEMHDLGDREEVGVLAFSEMLTIPPGDNDFFLPEQNRVVAAVEGLFVSELGFDSVECGIALHFGDGREVVIAAGNFPCSIVIKGMDGLIAEFDPEYPTERYRRRTV